MTYYYLCILAVPIILICMSTINNQPVEDVLFRVVETAALISLVSLIKTAALIGLVETASLISFVVIAETATCIRVVVASETATFVTALVLGATIAAVAASTTARECDHSCCTRCSNESPPADVL